MSENAVRKLRDELEEEIVSGAIAPGDRLDESQLAARFGVSRTPVREALMQLSAIGVVEIRPRRGAVVVEHGPQRVYEMFEVMGELEGLAGAHASRRLTADDRKALIAAHEACRAAAEAGDSDAYYYDNETFHNAIYDASHSQFLVEQCGVLHRRLRPFRRLQLRVRDRLKVSFEEHAAILQAIFDGDAEAARSLLRSHVVVQGDRFGDLLSALTRSGAGRTGRNAR